MIVLLFMVLSLSLFEVQYYKAAFIKYDDTCPTDCSQTNQPYFKHGFEPFNFNCTVGKLAEVKHFREKYMKQVHVGHVQSTFDAPKLVGITFYHKRFKDGHSEGALSISFEISERNAVLLESYKEVIRPFGVFKYPPAVLLHFQSVGDPLYKDDFYHKNPRERIFRLWDPTISTAMKHIGISYECFVGLDDSRPFRAYRLVMESAFGKSVTYNVTVPVQQGHNAGYMTEWRPTVATSFSPLERTLHVVFSDFKSVVTNAKLQNVSYSIMLLKGDGTVVKFTKKFNPTNFEILFKDLENGTYMVKVEKCEVIVNGKFQNCISTTSIGTEFSVTQIYGDANKAKLAISLAVVVFCSVGVTLVFYFKCFKKQKQTQTPVELCHFELTHRQNDRTLEHINLSQTDTETTHQTETEGHVTYATGDEIHKTDHLNDDISYSERDPLCCTESEGYDFYMDEFIKINKSRSTINSSDSRFSETSNCTVDTEQNTVQLIRSGFSSRYKSNNHTYRDIMERFVQINASSSSSGGSVSSNEIR